ncbi:hypothetical protein J6590_024901 [Homalodisca vitripennis]|nr:hypothetical protein J6590_024901 [Homalodisca vitripennis]
MLRRSGTVSPFLKRFSQMSLLNSLSTPRSTLISPFPSPKISQPSTAKYPFGRFPTTKTPDT